jgi:hypothetical protein
VQRVRFVLFLDAHHGFLLQVGSQPRQWGTDTARGRLYRYLLYQKKSRFLVTLISGIMVLLALGFLTPYFAFIPKASLAAVIISAVIFMIEYEVVKPMWRSSKKDLIATCATFVFCLAIGVEYGILVGVGINIMFLLYPSARPSVYVEKMKVQHWRKAMLSCFTLSSLFADCDEWYRVRYDYSRE